jgi:hypothetical protein
MSYKKAELILEGDKRAIQSVKNKANTITVKEVLENTPSLGQEMIGRLENNYNLPGGLGEMAENFIIANTAPTAQLELAKTLNKIFSTTFVTLNGIDLQNPGAVGNFIESHIFKTAMGGQAKADWQGAMFLTPRGITPAHFGNATKGATKGTFNVEIKGYEGDEIGFSSAISWHKNWGWDIQTAAIENIITDIQKYLENPSSYTKEKDKVWKVVYDKIANILVMRVSIDVINAEGENAQITLSSTGKAANNLQFILTSLKNELGKNFSDIEKNTNRINQNIGIINSIYDSELASRVFLNKSGISKGDIKGLFSRTTPDRKKKAENLIPTTDSQTFKTVISEYCDSVEYYMNDIIQSQINNKSTDFELNTLFNIYSSPDYTPQTAYSAALASEETNESELPDDTPVIAYATPEETKRFAKAINDILEAMKKAPKEDDTYVTFESEKMSNEFKKAFPITLNENQEKVNNVTDIGIYTHLCSPSVVKGELVYAFMDTTLYTKLTEQKFINSMISSLKGEDTEKSIMKYRITKQVVKKKDKTDTTITYKLVNTWSLNYKNFIYFYDEMYKITNLKYLNNLLFAPTGKANLTDLLYGATKVSFATTDGTLKRVISEVISI